MQDMWIRALLHVTAASVVCLRELLNRMTSEDAGGKTFICLCEITPCHVADGDNCDITMRGSTVAKVQCYKSECHWFDPSWCHWNFSLT